MLHCGRCFWYLYPYNPRQRNVGLFSNSLRSLAVFSMTLSCVAVNFIPHRVAKKNRTGKFGDNSCRMSTALQKVLTATNRVTFVKDRVQQ